MCDSCNPNSDKREIFEEYLSHDFYIFHQTGEWDEYGDDWIYDKIYINYCPWCGRRLD